MSRTTCSSDQKRRSSGSDAEPSRYINAGCYIHMLLRGSGPLSVVYSDLVRGLLILCKSFGNLSPSLSVAGDPFLHWGDP